MSDTQTMSVTPLDAPAGARVTGVDLSQPLSHENGEGILDALAEHGVLVFPDQNLTPAQQVEFSRLFGEVEINHNAARFGIEGSPEIYIISNVTKDGKPIGSSRAGEEWHSDMCYAKRPARATMLYAVEVPTLHGMTLGDTAFANAAAAWDDLPVETQRRIRDLRAVFDFTKRKRPYVPDAETIAKYPPVDHPMVRRHPRTGRLGLYVMKVDSTSVVGMEQEDARRLIDALSDHIVKPRFVYRHQWTPRDLVIWDNCTVQHKAIVDYDHPQRRLMWRTTIRGDVPV